MDNEGRIELNEIFQKCRDVLIDDFATLSKFVNDEQYLDAGMFCQTLAQGIFIFGEALAAEGLARKLEERMNGLDKPEGF